MNFLKNIVFVSYLKNKGVRRICFILGVICFIPFFILCYNETDFGYYSFKNIGEVREKRIRYDITYKVLEDVYKKYPFNFVFIDSFNSWENAFIDKYSDEYKLLADIRGVCKNRKEGENPIFDIKTPDEVVHEIKDICDPLDKYMTQPINVWTFRISHIPMLVLPVIAFYLFFIICCLVKWVYLGFKE